MSAYSYSAFDSSGKKQDGFVNASSEREARKLIKDTNLIPIEVFETSKNTKDSIKIKSKSLVVATRQLATLLDSDIALDQAIKMTADQMEDRKLSNVLFDIRDQVIQGKRLGESMMKYPTIFTNTYTSLVTAGDASGKLSLMFENLADYLEETESIKQKIISALTYPAILILFSLAVIIALLTFVMPQVVGQFIRAGVELPLLTKILLTISNNMIFIIVFFAIGTLLSLYYYQRIKSKPKQIVVFHKRILSLPIIGNFILKAELERFSSTMYLLMNSGINLDLSMTEATKVINNRYLYEVIDYANKEVSEGKDFIVALKKTKIFPDLFIQLISSGYVSGNLTKMFQKVSQFLKSEIENIRSMVLSLLEPAVIIIMGGFILLVVLAILIPIMQMNAIAIS